MNGPTVATSAGDGSSATEKIHDLAGQAQEQAQQAVGQAKGVVQQQLETRSTQLGEQVMSSAQDIRSLGQSLREQGREAPAKVIDQAAERVEGLAGYLTGANADRLLSDLEDLARRQPAVVVGACFALGFAASRFVKASSSRRHQTRTVGAAEIGSGNFGSEYGSTPYGATAYGGGRGGR
ncbi:MAG TPA: hypothetical protein VNE62_13025 [Actinomycetota bacterium]|nr:hypothetical protein [Actinomycetota bacterium]